MKRAGYEVSEIIEQFGRDYINKHHPNGWTLRTLNSLRVCRTSVLGGHKEQCDHCGRIRISYNSCRNRHCPKCQSSRQVFWVEEVSGRIIDTKYFHIVFTVPEELNTLCRLDSRWFYNTMFSGAWSALRAQGYMHYGTETGAIGVLHTWGQNLNLHPHIHFLVPAAGITLSGKVKKISKKGRYLYSVNQLSIDFRSSMLKALKRELIRKGRQRRYQGVIDVAWSKEWNVYSEASFAGSDRVIKYLGQYTHRVAIANSRIHRVDKQSVSFYYKDYRDHGKVKLTTLSGVEFLRRFSMHILPRGFVKIRYYGILSNRYGRQIAMYRVVKKRDEKETVQQRFKRLTGFDVYRCPYCKQGKMHKTEELPRIRSPVDFPDPKEKVVGA